MAGPLWLSGLVEENKVGDDNSTDRQDERSGDVEEAESSEDWLGTLKAIVRQYKASPGSWSAGPPTPPSPPSW